MISIKEQESLLTEISRKIDRKMTIFAVGGTAMMFLGFKDVTVDIDLVFNKENDRKEFVKAAKLCGYEDMDSFKIYGIKPNKPIMLERGSNRFDLFLIDVITLKFSDNMIKRAEDIFEYSGKLIVKIAHPVDIILMKSVTERAKDREDILKIISTSNIDWDIFMEEAKNQINIGDEKTKTAIFELYGTLIEINKKFNVKIPKDVFKEFTSIFGCKP